MKNKLWLAVITLLVLGGCTGVKDKLGLAKQSPDEFMVMSRAPLSLPPDYNNRPVTTDMHKNNPFDKKYSNLSQGERKFLDEVYADTKRK